MFARWPHVKMKVAQKALDQGRLDEALVAAAGIGDWSDERAATLRLGLVRALVDRARLHRQAGRTPPAITDLRQALTLIPDDVDARTLLDRIAREQHASDVRHAEHRRIEQQLDAGRLDSVRADLPKVDDAARRSEIAQALADRVQRASDTLERARELLRRGDLLAAIRTWEEASRRFGRTHDGELFAAELAAAARDAVAANHRSGRVDAVLAIVPASASLPDQDAALGGARRLALLCQQLLAQLDARDYAAMRETVLRIKAIQDDAPWVGAVQDALVRIAAAHDALLASPLGPLVGPMAPPAAARRDPARPALRTAASPAGAVRLDEPLVALVDGGSSALLIGADRVRIGRGGSSASVEVSLSADIDPHHADIVRRGADYFLIAYGPTRVNGREHRGSNLLLRDGDRIELGAAARMTFQQPSRKSGSAVLRLSHRSRLADDVSEVVLLSGVCQIGASPSCHLRTREDAGQAVLFESDGVMWGRAVGRDADLRAAAQPAIDGQTMELDGLRVTLKRTLPRGAAGVHA